MRLVFVTQVLDRGDAVLGFVPRWVEGLARRVERLRVVALEVGDTSGLPRNVDVRELGREGRLRRWWRYRRFLEEAFARDGFDTLLTHMVPRYSTVAARRARAHGVGHFLWYTHKGVDRRLERAVDAVDKVFTASPESLRVPTQKRVVTGHGIDLAHFDDHGASPAVPRRLLSVGRLTPAKDPRTLLAAFSILLARGHDLYLDLVGGPLAAGDEAFTRALEDEIRSGGPGFAERVTRHGAVPYRDVAPFYHRASVLVSASRTGSVDKVVLEAMAARRVVLTCNESFPPIFAELEGDARLLCFEPGNAKQLAERLEAILALGDRTRAALGERLRALVARDHEVESLVGRLVQEMQAPAGHRAGSAVP